MMTVLRIVSIVSRRNLHGLSRKPYKEVSIPVPWGKIAGKWWGSSSAKPILCLHGVQDNCGTFEPLVTFLDENEDFSFLAIDFPGHGYSSRFPAGQFYHFFNYPAVVKRICDYFKWQNVALMGHSLGALTSFTFTLMYPEMVKFLICIDALNPFVPKMNAETLRKGVDLLMKYDSNESLDDEFVAYTLQEAIEKVNNGYNNGIKIEKIPFLLERNIASSKKFPGKFYITRDPVLKMKIMCDLPHEQVVKDAAVITQPVFVCKARHHMYYGPKEHFYDVLNVLKKNSADCDFHYVDGTHYLHLNDPDDVGAHIKRFLKKHYKAEDSALNENSSVFCEYHPSPLKLNKYLII